MIHRQKLTLINVQCELNTKYGIDSQQFLQRLWHAFQTFSGFPVGEFLLKSDTKQTDCVKVYEKCNEGLVQTHPSSQLIKNKPIDSIFLICSAEGLDISKIVKIASFEQNLMDKAEWMPIDDEIVTEIHKKYHILPCSFPHAEHLKKYHLQPLKAECVKYSKVKQARAVMKICPIDDSLGILNKVRARKEMQQNKTKSKKSERKSLKQRRKRTIQKLQNQAAKAEVEGLDSAKKLHADTMDQYTTLSSAALGGQTFHSNESPNSSIAVGTRRISRCTTSTETQES